MAKKTGVRNAEQEAHYQRLKKNYDRMGWELADFNQRHAPIDATGKPAAKPSPRSSNSKRS